MDTDDFMPLDDDEFDEDYLGLEDMDLDELQQLLHEYEDHQKDTGSDMFNVVSLENFNNEKSVSPKVKSFLNSHFYGSRIPRMPAGKFQTKERTTGPARPFLVNQ
eukprot:TRINITY_DN2386_c1_g1_i1.p1 TRINITY_DN2386_c1_g1~~TRINITY_DN2386_c1_g1_i1.p1  ORF type:complete len:105 (+),score=28.56 TRINITY_DN2386_c1_g1_i1:49-363(+)